MGNLDTLSANPRSCRSTSSSPRPTRSSTPPTASSPAPASPTCRPSSPPHSRSCAPSSPSCAKAAPSPTSTPRSPRPSRAADAVTAAADDLPALIAQLNDVANRADAALATVGPDSRINRDTLLVLAGGPRRRPLGQRARHRTGAAPEFGPLREMSMRATLSCLVAAALALAPAARPDYYLLPQPPAAAVQRPRRSAASPSPTSTCRPTPARSRSPR